MPTLQAVHRAQNGNRKPCRELLFGNFFPYFFGSCIIVSAAATGMAFQASMGTRPILVSLYKITLLVSL